MKIKTFFRSFLRSSLLGFCMLSLAFNACSSSEQQVEEAVEEATKGDEAEEEEGYADEEGYEDSEYSDEVEETAKEVLDESKEGAEEVVEESESAAALESIMNDSPADGTTAKDEGSDYEEASYEEEELTASPGDTQDSNMPGSASLGAGFESLKQPGGAEQANPMDTETTVGTDAGPSAQSTVTVAPPSGSGVVFYVTVSKANLRQGPGMDQTIVGSLVQGDTVVGSIEGDWAQLSNGTYISSSLLSNRPVGRIRRASYWQSEK